MPTVLNPALYKLAAYTARLVAKPVDICSTQTKPSKIVPVTIDWVTFPTFAVTINMNQGTAGTTMDKIVGVYCDNSANVSDMVIVCPDTGYQVIVPALQQRFFPLMSRTNIVNIYNGETSNSLASGASITLLFTNFIINEFNTIAFPQVVMQGETSSSANGGNATQNFGFFVLGDQHTDSFFSLATPGSFSTLIAAPPVNAGLFIIRNLTVNVFGCYSQGIPINLNFGVCYGPITTVVMSFGDIVLGDDKSTRSKTLYQQSDKYTQLDATKAVNFFNSTPTALPSGFAYLSFDWAWVLSV